MSVILPLGRARIHTLVLPLPFQLREVNVYLIEGPGGVALVDTGLATHDARVALAAQLDALGQRVDRIAQVFITHHHGDHFGQAAWLQGQGARILMPRVDWAELEHWLHHPQADDQALAAMRRHGMPAPDLARTARAMTAMRAITPAFTPDTLVDDGDRIALAGETLEVILTPGHSPGHSCLHHPPSTTLLVGDHVLPHITPNVSVSYHADNPLLDYRRSLHRLYARGYAVALPSHGPPIVDLDARIDEILRHHEQRETLLLGSMGEEAESAHTLAGRLFALATLDGWETWMAVGETLAHLRALEHAGEVRALDDGTLTRFIRRSRTGAQR